MQNCKILNVGSSNIDYVYRVSHFLREGETLASKSLSVFPGGKGLNQSIALSRAGGQVYHAGKIGADGTWLLEVLNSARADTSFTEVGETATGHAIIQVNESGQNCILLFAGANCELEKAHLDRVLEHFAGGDILVLQNEVNHIAYLMEKAHQKGMRIAFNPSPIGPEIKDYPIEYVDWLILNEIEGEALSSKSSSKDILYALKEKYPKSTIVLTVGKDGVLYLDGKQELSHGVCDVSVVDTTAAGDTFTGFFISAMAAAKPPKEALALASIAASIAVSRPGAASSIPELEEALEICGQ